MSETTISNKSDMKFAISLCDKTVSEAIRLYEQGILVRSISFNDEEYDTEKFKEIEQYYALNITTGKYEYDMSYNFYKDQKEINRVITKNDVPHDIKDVISSNDGIYIQTADGLSIDFDDYEKETKKGESSVAKTVGSLIAAPIIRYISMKVNRIPELQQKLMDEEIGGLYHFTSERSADKIIACGKIKSSSRNSSYSLRKKTFFFNSNVGLDEMIYNCRNIDKNMTAIKVIPNLTLNKEINRGKVLVRLDDDAISIVGNVSEDKGYCLKKVNMKLVKNNGKYYYVEAEEKNKTLSYEEEKLDDDINQKLMRYSKMPTFLRDIVTFPRNSLNATNRFIKNIKNMSRNKRLLDSGNNNEIALESSLGDLKQGVSPDSDVINYYNSIGEKQISNGKEEKKR